MGLCLDRSQLRKEISMKANLSARSIVLAVVLVLLASLLAAAAPQGAAQASRSHNQVIVPGEDRFTPFSQTIRVGDSVLWVNMDTDDHTVVSDDAVNTIAPRRIDRLLKGTDNNGGKPGVVTLRFNQPGVFVYYCRFHSHLDADHQPVAPGPDGGIQDADGNHGTPMMGIITVLPAGQ
jgi:plastocyanin